VLLLALAMSAPALYRYFIVQDLEITDALARYLVAVPVAAVMLAVFRMVVAGYGRPAAPPSLQGAQPPAPVVQPEPMAGQPN